MKKSKSKKLSSFMLFLFIFLICSFFFKNQIFMFLIRFNKIEEIIYKTHLDEYLNLDSQNNNIHYLRYSHMINDKNLFDFFHYSKKYKNKKFDFNANIIKSGYISSVIKTNSMDNIINYKYQNDKNSSFQMNSIVLLPNDIISCECLENLNSKTLIFENKGVAANKIESPSYISLTYDNNEIDSFEIKNNKITKIQIPLERKGKSFSIHWNKNPSGILFFHGFEKELPKNKLIFITLKSSSIDDNFFNKFKELFQKNNIFINRNSFPVASKYSDNIIALESFTSYINNGFTYNSHDIFNENEKNILKLANINSKDFLRINVSDKDPKDSIIEHSNMLIKILREKSISNIDKIITESIKNSVAEIIRIDISTKNGNAEDTLLNILNQIDKSNHIFVLIGNDYDFNKNQLISNQSIAIALANDEKNILESLNKFAEDIPIQQNIIIDILSQFIRNNDKFDKNFMKQKAILIHSRNEEFFIFNNTDYFNNNKFIVPYNKFNEYSNTIKQLRSKYQIRDILLSFFKFKNIKFKITSKDKISRCFSNKNIKLGQIYFDSKFETYIADLKILGDDVIEELQVSCLLYSENFLTDYKIEVAKDGKQLNQLQIGIGEYLMQPNSNLITDNSLNISNLSDFNLFYSLKSPENHNKNTNNDVIIWSHFYPNIPENLNFNISYKEKK